MTDSPAEATSCWTIAVLAGGDTAEREVSLNSGQAVAAALRAGGHQVLEFDPVETPPESIDWHGLQIDAVFLALHGAYGEDGQIQALLEQQRIPYTGSDARASALAFSKIEAKHRFLEQGIPTPDFAIIYETDSLESLEQLAGEIGYPCVVKPDRQGSSIGVTIVHSPEGLPAALNTCFQYGSTGLIEEGVMGDEWTVGILDNLVFPPIRIGTARTFFDYTAKYADDATQYEFNAAPASLTTWLADLGRTACQALGTSGIARVDLRLDQAGRPYVLEVNTIPGMTDHSLVPKAALQTGLSMTGLCEQAISAALYNCHRQTSQSGPTVLTTSVPHRRAG